VAGSVDVVFTDVPRRCIAPFGGFFPFPATILFYCGDSVFVLNSGAFLYVQRLRSVTEMGLVHALRQRKYWKCAKMQILNRSAGTRGGEQSKVKMLR
jgi:hypothetical protein